MIVLLTLRVPSFSRIVSLPAMSCHLFGAGMASQKHEVTHTHEHTQWMTYQMKFPVVQASFLRLKG